MHSSPPFASTLCRRAFSKKSGALSCLRALLLAVLAVVFLWPAEICAQSAQQREYDIKAAYLYRFLNYIDWPADTLPGAGGTITIGIVGEDPFGPSIDWLKGKQIKGRTLAVRLVATPKDFEQCQIIFISASEKARLPEILAQLKDARVLTVSEVDGFAAQGGIINFFSERNKVRFEINLEVARRTGLLISSELLKLAKLVKS